MKSAKFIITGDIHFKSNNPVARKDLYIEALLTKLSEVFELAEEYKVDAVLIPGDLFDSPSVSIPTIVKLAKALRNSPCPVLTIPGNHDEFGHSLESISRTPYGILRDFDYIRCVYDNSWLFTGAVDGLVTGHGFDNETDIDLEQYMVPEVAIDTYEGIFRVMPSSKREYTPFYIHMVHGMLLDKTGFDGMRHTLVSQLAQIPEQWQPHVLVCGHYHTGLAIQRVPGTRTLVINPGALGRLSASVDEMERTVQVALLTVNGAGEGEYFAELIPLKSALAGDMVLSREHLEAERERSGRLDKFLSLLASEGESKFLEVRDIVEDLAARENIPEDVKKEALKRIGVAREILGKTGEV